MKSDYYWIAVQIQENGKYYAYAIRVSIHDNLISKLATKNIVAANICHTKKTVSLASFILE